MFSIQSFDHPLNSDSDTPGILFNIFFIWGRMLLRVVMTKLSVMKIRSVMTLTDPRTGARERFFSWGGG